ncbi:hypothetical protein KFE25_004694 [Diacronema lutheri]|uniref:Uncharacterized protein n=1 Tax=Diacronema lutheri TaxID=2081491 RepID=A0A8J5XEZ1_DIALT|nr:hypothetical protein KFE25_004694 [Diacronema lutheri]
MSTSKPLDTRQRRNLSAERPAGRQPWTPAEDALLIAAISEHGARKWTRIASALKGRRPSQCSDRWRTQLAPGLRKDEWSAEEDALIVAHAHSSATPWSLLSNLLPGRSRHAVKNRYNTLMRAGTSVDATRTATGSVASGEASAAAHEPAAELSAAHAFPPLTENELLALLNSPEEVRQCPSAPWSAGNTPSVALARAGLGAPMARPVAPIAAATVTPANASAQAIVWPALLPPALVESPTAASHGACRLDAAGMHNAASHGACRLDAAGMHNAASHGACRLDAAGMHNALGTAAYWRSLYAAGAELAAALVEPSCAQRAPLAHAGRPFQRLVRPDHVLAEPPFARTAPGAFQPAWALGCAAPGMLPSLTCERVLEAVRPHAPANAFAGSALSQPSRAPALSGESALGAARLPTAANTLVGGAWLPDVPCDFEWLQHELLPVAAPCGGDRLLYPRGSAAPAMVCGRVLATPGGQADWRALSLVHATPMLTAPTAFAGSEEHAPTRFLDIRLP